MQGAQLLIQKEIFSLASKSVVATRVAQILHTDDVIRAAFATKSGDDKGCAVFTFQV